MASHKLSVQLLQTHQYCRNSQTFRKLINIRLHWLRGLFLHSRGISLIWRHFSPSIFTGLFIIRQTLSHSWILINIRLHWLRGLFLHSRGISLIWRHFPHSLNAGSFMICITSVSKITFIQFNVVDEWNLKHNH